MEARKGLRPPVQGLYAHLRGLYNRMRQRTLSSRSDGADHNSRSHNRIITLNPAGRSVLHACIPPSCPSYARTLTPCGTVVEQCSDGLPVFGSIGRPFLRRDSHSLAGPWSKPLPDGALTPSEPFLRGRDHDMRITSRKYKA